MSRLFLFGLFVAYALALSAALGRRGLKSRPATPGAPRARPVRVLIVGATGGTGRELVRQALERGHDVTALVRRPAALGLEHPQLRIAVGDVLDRASIDAAVRGQDAVVSALGHKRFFGPTRILSDGTRTLLQAMEAAGVGRLVTMTTLGLGDTRFRMGLYYTFVVIPLIVPFYFWDKTRQERLVEASRVDWIIVRPGALTSGPGRGAVRHGPGVGSWLRTVRISRADTAAFILDQLTDDTYLKCAPGLSW